MALTKDRIDSIEAKTNDLLINAYGSNISLPVSLAKIVSYLGLTISTGHFEDDNIDGYYVKSEKTIYISSSAPLSRKLFTIAHEIGHFLLHNKEREVFYRTDSLNIDIQDQTEEQEANWFAASLLMPENYIREYWDDVQNIHEMALIFNVSQIAMAYRLKNLKIT